MKVAYWILFTWTIVMIILLLGSKLTFGEGLGDLIYAFYSILFLI
jgi:hypothetical protein